ncbi:class I SAM-dependent methyltransferase [Nodosilinea sp. E11]|uniref:class I SAM-dependent methyltransferase n=1 Tax=Nodosilinea sp. E11 TaxID=3037479 RepID=UPI0029351481|nr:methyltransferase domain-containing protein [Nodosilinea sp. E11]WOD41095.1 methyltransferase domain-containing protein [Nodosilinea sp. E11]
MDIENKFFDPFKGCIGGYGPLDGTVEFYGRINSLLKPDFKVLDYGAGRGYWFFEDKSAYRRSVRGIKDKVAQLIGMDIDSAVLSNPTTSYNIQLTAKDDCIPLEDESIDMIICDYVLEHLSRSDSLFLKKEAQRILKKGGFFCARTPHSLNYVCLGSRLLRGSLYLWLLQKLQPDRKNIDVFPTKYICNTHREISCLFDGWNNFSYTYTSEPQYYMKSELLFSVLSVIHRLMPAALTGNLFIFLQKS